MHMRIEKSQKRPQVSRPASDLTCPLCHGDNCPATIAFLDDMYAVMYECNRHGAWDYIRRRGDKFGIWQPTKILTKHPHTLPQ